MSEQTPEPSPKPRKRSAKPRPEQPEATPGPEAAAKPSAPAAPKSATEAPATSVPVSAGSTAPAAAEPNPLDVPLEEQITALPPLEYPGNPNEDFVVWAADKRRGRIRVEIIGGVFLVMLGVAISIFTGRSAFIVIALFAVGGLAAYEFLVTSFE
jgi:hypothetical protein